MARLTHSSGLRIIVVRNIKQHVLDTDNLRAEFCILYLLLSSLRRSCIPLVLRTVYLQFDDTCVITKIISVTLLLSPGSGRHCHSTDKIVKFGPSLWWGYLHREGCLKAGVLRKLFFNYM